MDGSDKPRPIQVFGKDWIARPACDLTKIVKVQQPGPTARHRLRQLWQVRITHSHLDHVTRMSEGFENGAGVFQPLAIVRPFEFLACAFTNDRHEGFVQFAFGQQIAETFHSFLGQ